MEYIEISAKTVDEAITEALVKLGTTSDRIEYEIVEKGNNGFLGIGRKDAVIKVRKKYSVNDDIKDFLNKVFEAMDLKVEIVMTAEENSNVINVDLKGDDMGVLIGKRGQTLDSLQYLTNLAVNKNAESFVKVKIDTEDYRKRRRETLENLAKNIAYKVKRTKRPVSLEPMNPYERRIIHSTVARIEGVTSSSTGEEPNRRVVISPINPRPLQGGGRGGRGGRGRAGANRTARRDERVPRDGEHSGQRSERAPRRERGPRRDDRSTRGETVKPTSTEVDRAYAAELERAGALERPAQAIPRTQQKPVRQQARHEGDDLPLYGKIDL